MKFEKKRKVFVIHNLSTTSTLCFWKSFSLFLKYKTNFVNICLHCPINVKLYTQPFSLKKRKEKKKRLVKMHKARRTVISSTGTMKSKSLLVVVAYTVLCCVTTNQMRAGQSFCHGLLWLVGMW